MRWLYALLILPVALAFTPSSVSVTVVLSPDGGASVKEDYTIVLRPDEVNTFKALQEKLGNSFLAWLSSKEVEGFDYHVGNDITDLRDVTLVTRVRDNLARITVSYYVPDAAVKKKEEPTRTTWLFNAFHFPMEGDALQVPEGYSVTVYIPQTATLLDYRPEATVRGNEITWEGPFSTNQFYVQYTVIHPPAVPSLIEFLAGMSYSTYFLWAAIVVVLLIVWKRGELREMIEKYVEENTHLEE